MKVRKKEESERKKEGKDSVKVRKGEEGLKDREEMKN